ncbi:MAG TPA: glycosyltransferase family 4 protein [Terriglobales bacterium]|nr:glycosyltransferase family 4 protein [Terriglobales bacterium]
MRSRQSPLAKVWASISKYGLRAGLRDAAARWGRGRLKLPYDVLGDYGWVLAPDRPARLKASPRPGALSINWLVPDVSWGSGGLFNIFRSIRHLEQWGHKNRVYVVGAAGRGSALAQVVNRKYFPIQAPVQPFTGEMADSEALVATSWVTAYAARALENTARKFYFVQDLEHLFFPPGSLHEFARQTYGWGFHGITAGPWIAQVLEREFGMRCSSFGFSFDREIYSAQGRRRLPEGKKRVLFYARPASERRGFELGVLALSLVAQKMPEAEFVLVGFPRQPLRLPFSAALPGVLPPTELAGLYRSCEVALVLSHTNLSLLPLELMACGCAVVSNSGPNVEWLLTAEAAQLTPPTPDALAGAVLTLLENDDLRARKAAAGLALAQSTDWMAASRAIEAGLRRGLELAREEGRSV